MTYFWLLPPVYCVSYCSGGHLHCCNDKRCVVYTLNVSPLSSALFLQVLAFIPVRRWILILLACALRSALLIPIVRMWIAAVLMGVVMFAPRPSPFLTTPPRWCVRRSGRRLPGSVRRSVATVPKGSSAAQMGVVTFAPRGFTLPHSAPP